LASAAVPGFIPPVCLLKKLPNGEVVPHSLEGKHRDGSIRADIPIGEKQIMNFILNVVLMSMSEALNLFNSKYTVVSQINP
jgi:predicted acylesterase/phospholipase RssA